MEATINEKAMRAIGTYLERRGSEILERVARSTWRRRPAAPTTRSASIS